MTMLAVSKTDMFVPFEVVLVLMRLTNQSSDVTGSDSNV